MDIYAYHTERVYIEIWKCFCRKFTALSVYDTSSMANRELCEDKNLVQSNYWLCVVTRLGLARCPDECVGDSRVIFPPNRHPMILLQSPWHCCQRFIVEVCQSFARSKLKYSNYSLVANFEIVTTFSSLVATTLSSFHNSYYQ